MDGGPASTSDSDGLPDRELMKRIRADDEPALELLIQRYWMPLVRYAIGFLDRKDDAEDAVQDAFVRVWRSRRSWRPEGSTSGYLYSIVRNLCLHRTDRREVRDRFAEREKGRSRFRPTPADVYQERAVLDKLDAAIERLPERRREVFTLACLHGLSYREVAEAMGIAVSTVANQMSSALDELREALEEVSDLTI